jgi:hypothetical protein
MLSYACDREVCTYKQSRCLATTRVRKNRWLLGWYLSDLEVLYLSLWFTNIHQVHDTGMTMSLLHLFKKV